MMILPWRWKVPLVGCGFVQRELSDARICIHGRVPVDRRICAGKVFSAIVSESDDSEEM